MFGSFFTLVRMVVFITLFCVVMVYPVFQAHAADAPIPKTGQTTSYATGDDGELQKGVAWPSPRFTDKDDGTVLDNLTGLIWLKNASCATDAMNWSSALTYVATLAEGSCSLSDGSSAGNWRLPNRRELFSLVDSTGYNPALPSGHPFTSVQGYYWSGTTYIGDTSRAWYLYLYFGEVGNASKTLSYRVWPVRDAIQ